MQTARSSRPSFVPAPFVPAVPHLPRLDLYGPVHKGLRWALSSVLARLAACTPTDPASVQVALDDLEGTLYLFAYHAGHEDRHIHVALEARRAGCSAVFAAAHERQEQQIAELHALAAALATAQPSEAAALLRTVYLRFAAFAGDNLAHMTEEEEVSQRLLETLYAPEELAQIQKRLLSSIGPDEMRAFLRVMALGATRHERAVILQRAQLTLPDDAFAALSTSVRAALDDEERLDLAMRLRC